MAKDHRRVNEGLVQEALLDDPDFLKEEIVERVVQEVLEAEMTEHIGGGAAPYERGEGRKGQRNGHLLRADRPRLADELDLHTGQGRDHDTRYWCERDAEPRWQDSHSGPIG